jgi:hypothetical protein
LVVEAEKQEDKAPRVEDQEVDHNPELLGLRLLGKDIQVELVDRELFLVQPIGGLAVVVEQEQLVETDQRAGAEMAVLVTSG